MASEQRTEPGIDKVLSLCKVDINDITARLRQVSPVIANRVSNDFIKV